MMWESPAVVVRGWKVVENVRRMQALGVAVRPHAKTHKSLQVARLQVDHGACGVTCAKPREAQVFLDAGFDVLLAYPFVQRQSLRLLQSPRVTFMVDSHEGLANLAEECHGAKVRIKIDVGLGRCGVRVDTDEGTQRAVELANALEAKGLVFDGIMSHAGHAYAAKDAAECAAIADAELKLMRRVKTAILQSGMESCAVSVGCTLTELARKDLEGVDEIRPGNYVYMDQTPWRKGLIQGDDIALYVLATVVSKNEDYVIIDAGSKTLSSDGGAHGTAASSFGLCFPHDGKDTFFFPNNIEDVAIMTIEKLSEEHGWIRNKGMARELRVGDLIRVIPNHSCPVVNLTDFVWVEDQDGQLKQRWKVDARGCV